MKIYLIRHASAVGIGGGIVRDAQRTLTNEGKSEAAHVARAMKSIGVKPDILVTSPLIRAKETAEILQSELGGELHTSDSLAPGVTPANVFRFLSKFPDANEIVLAGHEPDMGDLVKVLVGGGIEFSMPFTQAGVCCVEVVDVPPSMAGILKWLITPAVASKMMNK